MYLQIKTIKVVPDKYSAHLAITMIGAYTDEGKWLKWVKISDEAVVDALSKIKIPFEL